uniref:Uncharacterized protein n=1 Tax=Parascaris equorum TaxID=6256 RepID=A0A914RDF1_PAREQ
MQITFLRTSSLLRYFRCSGGACKKLSATLQVV